MLPRRLVFIALLLLGACTPSAISPSTLPATRTALVIPTIPPTITTSPTSPPTATRIPATPTAPPTATPAPVVQIYYEDYAQVEIVSPQGTRVLIDVYQPQLLTAQPGAADALLTTHYHFDHLNDAFVAAFPGQQLYVKSGEIDMADVRITGISSAHNEGDAFRPSGGTDYIYLIEVGGLRIAHFGDIGQDAFTQDQLDTFGKIDIAITQFSNSFAQMNAANQKGFHLMQQVQPKLIIPTHIDGATMKIAAELWGGYASPNPAPVRITDLPAQTRLLVLGSTAEMYQSDLQLDAWGG